MHNASFVYVLATIAALLAIPFPGSAQEPAYVGSKVCSQCHDSQYDNFVRYSKKAHSWNSIAVMQAKLKRQELVKCYECHTTGYGKNGGFTSKESTPNLAEVGCETCHGPGSLHAESAERKQINRKPSIETCNSCHSAERVNDFRFKPLIYSGAH